MTRQALVFKSLVLALTVLGVTARATHPVIENGGFIKNRYIAVFPVDGTLAIRVTLTESLQFAAAEGMTWWVGEPDENCMAGLVDSELTRDWSDCPTLYIGDCGIVPVSEYTLVGVYSGGHSSEPFVFMTSLRPNAGKWWGDAVGSFTGDAGIPPNVWTAPQGVTNFDEVVAALKTFQDKNAITATHTSITDIHPRVPNRIVNIDDVFFF